MLVSYIVTIYNKVPYLPYLLAGLSAQAGAFEREFIFVDDGSCDSSADLLSALTRGWRNTTIIRQDNAGPAPALNRGIAAARGDMIKPMDGDDILVPGATTALLNALSSTGLAVAFGGCETYSLGMAEGPAGVLKNAEILQSEAEALTGTLGRSLRHPLSNSSGWLAKSDVVRKSCGCDTRVFIQDVSIELRLSLFSDFAQVNRPVFLAPEAAPGRLSDNQAQILHDYNLAVCLFITDHPELSIEHRRLAVQRIFGCAWKWRRRRESGSLLTSREFWAFAASRLGWIPSHRERFIDLASGTFRRTHAIRLPQKP